MGIIGTKIHYITDKLLQKLNYINILFAGHFENFEVRYHVDPRYSLRGGGQDRSRREKFEREVSERVQRRPRTTSGGAGDERY